MSSTATVEADSIVQFTYDVGNGNEEKLLCPVGTCTQVMPPSPYKTGSYFPDLFTNLPAPGSTATVKDMKLANSNPDMIATIQTAQLTQSGLNPEDLKLGQTLFLQNGMKAEIVGTTDNSITIDANPPLSRLNGITMTVTTDSVTQLTSSHEKTGTLSAWTTATWDNPKYEAATFAGGCFWGVELAFQRAPGVVGTKVGYTQGRVHSPSYEAVCSGTTGHTEGVQVVFDNTQTTYEDLCNLLVERLGDNIYKKNQVGNDQGTQVRVCES